MQKARRDGDGEARLLLRFEDTDRARSHREFAEAIAEALRWLGLDWDGEPVFQSDRVSLYVEHLERLEREGKAYRCTCDPAELAKAREMARAAGRRYRYPGTCRDRKHPPAPGQPYVLRLKVPERELAPVMDRVVGRIGVSGLEIDDFVLTRSDGSPLYNLCCVVDDATMGITHVIRGADHIENTRKQALLFDAFGYARPEYAHLPLVSGLSKRLGSTSVLTLRDQGFLPDAVVNYIARLGWSHGDQELFSRQELIDLFRLADVGHSPGRVNEDKLRWLNEKHLHRARPSELARLVEPWLPRGLDAERRARLLPALEIYRTRCSTLIELAEAIAPCLAEDEEVSSVGGEESGLLDEAMRTYLVELANLVERVEPYDRVTLKASMWEQLQARGMGFRQVAPACRLALIGRSAGPRLLDLMIVLGRQSTARRLRRAGRGG